jgi:hypothetical protein
MKNLLFSIVLFLPAEKFKGLIVYDVSIQNLYMLLCSMGNWQELVLLPVRILFRNSSKVLAYSWLEPCNTTVSSLIFLFSVAL